MVTIRIRGRDVVVAQGAMAQLGADTERKICAELRKYRNIGPGPNKEYKNVYVRQLGQTLLVLAEIYDSDIDAYILDAIATSQVREWANRQISLTGGGRRANINGDVAAGPCEEEARNGKSKRADSQTKIRESTKANRNSGAHD